MVAAEVKMLMLVLSLALVIPAASSSSLQERLRVREDSLLGNLLVSVVEREAGPEISIGLAEEMSPAVRHSPACPSMGNLAASNVPGLFSDVYSKRSAMCSNRTISPDDPAVHEARKAILALRTFLDVFSPVYPAHLAEGQGDKWSMLRGDVDKGYEIIGTLQDLAHSGAKYKPRDAKEARAKVDEWCDYMDNRELANQYEEFVSHPHLEKLYSHSKQSHFFWGGYVPSTKHDGMENIRMLFERQVGLAIDLAFDLFKVDEIFSEEAHERFHDFRKALRSMLNQKDMCGGFLERTSTAAAETFHTFQYLYDDFGALNDLRNGYIFALSHHNMDQARELGERVTARWRLLKDELRESVVLAKAKALPKHVCKCVPGCE